MITQVRTNKLRVKRRFGVPYELTGIPRSQAILNEHLAQGTISLEKLGLDVIPPGAIWPYSGGPILDGFLPMDGSFYNPELYTYLFAEIGYTHGQAGSLFAVPDSRKLILVGPGGGWSVGDIVGEFDTVLSSANMPAHRHASASHTHSYRIPTSGKDPSLAGVVSTADPKNWTQRTTGRTTTSNPTLIVNSYGNGGNHNNIGPTFVATHLIKY